MSKHNCKFFFGKEKKKNTNYHLNPSSFHCKELKKNIIGRMLTVHSMLSCTVSAAKQTKPKPNLSNVVARHSSLSSALVLFVSLGEN